MKTRLAVMALATMLTACGFHLRGSEFSAEELSVDSVFVQGHGSADALANQVTDDLKNAGIKITDSPGDAQYHIAIQTASFTNSVLSVSPQTGQAEEYQLTLRATASVRKKGVNRPLNTQSVSVYRDYTSDDRRILGTFNEVDKLRDDLVRDAADQVLRIFRAALNKNR